jgi:hypothetical protein
MPTYLPATRKDLAKRPSFPFTWRHDLCRAPAFPYLSATNAANILLLAATRGETRWRASSSSGLNSSRINAKELTYSHAMYHCTPLFPATPCELLLVLELPIGVPALGGLYSSVEASRLEVISPLASRRTCAVCSVCCVAQLQHR